MKMVKIFFREVLNAWRAKARCNVVPAERTQELFNELSFHPSEKQISDMLQTAKVLARKGSRQSNGLTFGEFCVLAADLKRFRASTFATATCSKVNYFNAADLENASNASEYEPSFAEIKAAAELRSTKSLSNVKDCQKPTLKSTDVSTPVEVFLGGSCNPTTWRADVAIPALKELGISFYNPQVSDWTPDLIELEHRAKEKARVLFFVMDSETRASAGAIEAAHIAGQNCKQLVLVLHPYKPKQYILNEHISQQEYIDLTRNQLLLRELVTRRGLPVLDNIPSGLQRTKEILAGIRDPPSNIASILVVVRGAFDRVSPVNDIISVKQCQRALLYLGYAQSLLNLDNLNKIIAGQQQQQQQQQDLIDSQTKCSTKQHAQPNMRHNSNPQTNKQTDKATTSSSSTSSSSSSSSTTSSTPSTPTDHIDFDLFCIISAYLSVLQQEIHESGCISPIKGTNVPPPPIYLTNMQGDESFAISYLAMKNISRNSSNASVSGDERERERQSLNDLLSRSRDSGTSSPQPLELLKLKSQTHLCNKKTQILVNVESIETTEITTTQTTLATSAGGSGSSSGSGASGSGGGGGGGGGATATPYAEAQMAAVEADESDSNDSVFSSNSSINSINCNYTDALTFPCLEFRDVYLGGSCFLRTKWRQDIAVPYLKSKGVTFHLPALHESLQQTPGFTADGSEKAMSEDARPLGSQERSLTRTRRKFHGSQIEEEEVTLSEESFSWALLPARSNLFNPALLDSSRVLLFVITNETRSLAPMTLAAHCIGLMYNVVLAVQMLPDDCTINNEKLTAAAIKDYNRGRSYLIDLAKRQGVPVFTDLKAALECTVEKIRACNSRNRFD